jgi:3-hydroxyisobutyrate dehydrogenase-like beta-hydroxyacid dehydrogenase
MAKVGFFGLGIMGSGMVQNLIKAGHDVTVWNRTESRSEGMKQYGAKVAPSLTDLVKGADFVMYCLANDEAVNDLVISGQKLTSIVEPQTIVIDLSTIDPATSDKERALYEARGIKFLDAPVFGTKGEAERGGLWIVIGGENSVFNAAKPVLEPISETLHYMGTGGAGTKMKLVGNLLVASQLEALGEALTLAKKAGLNLHDVRDVLEVADFRTPIYSGVSEGASRDDYTVNFALKLLLKDLKLIKEFSNRIGSPTPSVDVAQKFVEIGLKNGLGELNASAIVKVIAGEGGVDLVG